MKPVTENYKFLMVKHMDTLWKGMDSGTVKIFTTIKKSKQEGLRVVIII